MVKGIRIAEKRKSLRKLNSTNGNILSPEEFRALVNYERSRSDRNGSVFSIAVFDSLRQTSKNLDRFLVLISQFTRSIDCVGWNERGRVTVLLPDTARPGAEIFGQKLLAEMDARGEDLVELDIYTYPEHWLENEHKEKPSAEDRTQKVGSVKSSIEMLFVYKMPWWKRTTDILGSSFLLLLTSPVFLFLSLYIKIVSPGPVFFKQTRIGFKGVPFTFWKFRTMKYDNNQSFHGKHAQSFIKEGDIPMEKLDNRDPRIFTGGHVIRKSCLDELPQLWNILKGEMSLVGPRPCIPYEAREYLRWHTHRFDTVPGLSGLWQVSGKNKLTFKQMIRLDIAYCRNMSFFGDLIIILKTPLAIIQMVAEAFLNKYFHKEEDVISFPADVATERKV